MNSIFYNSTEQLLERLNTMSTILLIGTIFILLIVFCIAFITCNIHENIKEIKRNMNQQQNNSDTKN